MVVDANSSNMNTMIWNNALKLLENDMNKPTFDTWFKSTELVSYCGENVIIKVQNDFAKNNLENNYFNIIKNHLESMLNHPVKIQFVTPQEKDQAIEKLLQQQGYSNEEHQKNDFPTVDRVAEPKPPAFETSTVPSKDTGLNPKYTFDTFVVGNSNRLTHAACVGVADNISADAAKRIYNPLFIYGGAGLGKTHLMHSIGNHILQRKPDTKITYLSSETFTNEMIDAIKDNKNKDFRNKYRNVDVLLIDDIQFISSKEGTQEEFFHTFNTLHGANKQIILSSDRPPKDMDILEDRIRSRFEWGLLADIQSPDYETRIAILRKKQELDGYSVSDDVIEYIASNIKSNIRELEGALNKIIAYANLEKREINIDLAEQVLRDIISPNEKKVITPEFIIDTVADHFDITPSDIVGSKRSSKIVFPRQIAMYLCREMLDAPLTGIGKMMGDRDHTTVMHGIEKIEKEMSAKDSVRNTVDILKKKINPSK